MLRALQNIVQKVHRAGRVGQRRKSRVVECRNQKPRCDAYRFFEQTQGLVITGPTWTNVCDLRVTVLPRSKTT